MDLLGPGAMKQTRRKARETDVVLERFSRRRGVEKAYGRREARAEQRRRLGDNFDPDADREKTPGDLAFEWLWRQSVRGGVNDEERKLIDRLAEDLDYFTDRGTW